MSSNPREAIEQVNTHMTSQGFTQVGAWARNANLPTGGMMAYAMDVQPGSCYTAIAVGAQGMDLNMVVLDAAGQNVGYNVNPDAHPWVTACPSQGGRYLARLQLVSGSGEYYYALYRGPGGNQISLAGLFGEAQAAAVQSAQIDPQTNQRLTTIDQELARDNFRRVGNVQGLQMSAGEDRNFPLTLNQGFCYAFATLGGQGAQDTDVFVVDGDGNQLAQDVSTELDAVARYCPSSTGSYTLRARMYQGEGPLFIAGWVQSTGGQVAQTNLISTQSTGGVGLEENFRLLNSDMQARGYQAWGQPTRGRLGQGETQDFGVSLEGSKCYAILAVGDNTVRDLDILLLDGNGQEIDRDIETDPRPIVRVCPNASGQFTMRVRMYSGSGNFVYAAYRWPRGTRGPFGLSGLIYVRLAEVTSLLNVENYQPDVDATPDRGSLRREGQTATHQLRLPAGQCFAILVVGGDGVADLDVTLSQGSNELASDGTRNAFPAVRHCTQGEGRYTLSVRAAGGSGDYFYQVFRRGS